RLEVELVVPGVVQGQAGDGEVGPARRRHVVDVGRSQVLAVDDAVAGAVAQPGGRRDGVAAEGRGREREGNALGPAGEAAREGAVGRDLGRGQALDVAVGLDPERDVDRGRRGANGR